MPEKVQDVNVLHEFPPLYNPPGLPSRRVLRARILSRFGKPPVLDIRWWDANEGFTKNGVSIPLEARALFRLESVPAGAIKFANDNGLHAGEEGGVPYDWDTYFNSESYFEAKGKRHALPKDIP